jgi:phosphoglycerate dehydrogenase-like enzyme
VPQISVAVLPSSRPEIDAAVQAAGGVVEAVGPQTRAIVISGAAGADGLVEVLAKHPDIHLVQLPSAGVEAYNDMMTAAARDGLTFTSAKGAYAEPVAEHALALTLALLRSLPERARATSWDTVPKGISLHRLNVTVIGAGGIALEYIRLLTPFDTNITVVRRKADPVEGANRTITTDQLLEVLPDTDVIMVAAALTGGTRQLFGAAEFAAMKETAVLVNIARGGLIDTDALVTALQNGDIGGAGLDVTDPEPLPDGHALWSAPGAIITPHNADTPEMVAPLFAERIRANVAAAAAAADKGSDSSDGSDANFVGVVDVEAGY